jgi:uncharacterized protein YhbP (UPF0306 family)
MTPLPDAIQQFILGHHVLSLATTDHEGVWAASCFYSFDATQSVFFILSSPDTRHGRAMLETSGVAGTISGQPVAIHEIRGVQFSATAHLLDGQERDIALRHYVSRHPLARLKSSAIWQLRINALKFTDNSRVFGHKTLWTR